MRKRLVALFLSACMVTSLAACAGEAKDDKKSGSEAKREPVIETEDIRIYQYKGLEVTLENSMEVTEEDIDASIKSTMSVYAAENTEDTAEEGDDVIIDYVGKVDGEAFTGGSAEDQSLTIGAGKYIPGFEEGIIGHKVGETFDVPVTFLDKYTEELAGKDAVFTMTLKGITPEITDEWVKQLSLTSKTVEEYREEQRKSLEVSNQNTYKYELEGAVWDALVNQCVMDSYPQEMVDEQYATLETMFSNLLELYTLDQLVQSYYGITAEAYVTNIVKQTFAVQAIAEAEGIEVTEEEYALYLEEYAYQYGYTDSSEFETAVGKEVLEANFLNREVGLLLVDNCIVNSATE